MFKLYKRISCSTVSNAFCMSTKIPQPIFTLSTFFPILSSKANKGINCSIFLFKNQIVRDKIDKIVVTEECIDSIIY